MTRDEAEALYALLRSVCILGPKHTLHVGGHTVKLPDPPERNAPPKGEK
jgi:hypothetical protein